MGSLMTSRRQIPQDAGCGEPDEVALSWRNLALELDGACARFLQGKASLPPVDEQSGHESQTRLVSDQDYGALAQLHDLRQELLLALARDERLHDLYML